MLLTGKFYIIFYDYDYHKKYKCVNFNFINSIDVPAITLIFNVHFMYR